MSRSMALAVLAVALILGGLAYWGAPFFGGSETVPLLLGYAAAGLAAGAVVVSEFTKVRS